ncbi:MAG TPA: hypothetical protein PL010_12105 [Flavobacteriales bacterium]|nr:hypothetical protein [Flavobacteriales bacterium]HNA32557.1 hypothetical protein [Flavobacteriales bacterium]HNE79750.1 hypothetical protein [Flavobacteriales bacterium]HNI05359.1 hypothetical protein [Flavobacteriales bacterium]HNK86276.1 hypothetical protein [Flavobacteriales bacterium]
MSTPYIAHEAAAPDGTARYALHGLTQKDMECLETSLELTANLFTNTPDIQDALTPEIVAHLKELMRILQGTRKL